MKGTPDVGSHGALIALSHQIKDYEGWLLLPGQLQSLGVHASRVDLANDESLQFEPCFFRPYSTKVRPLVLKFDARRHEFEAGIPHEIQPSFPQNPCPPTYEAFLKEYQENSPDGSDLKAVFDEYSDQLKNYSSMERWPIRRARELSDYLDWYLDLELDGLLRASTLCTLCSAHDLVHHERWGPDRQKYRSLVPPYDPWSKEWHIKEMHRYSDRGSSKPHMVISLLSGVRATGLDQGLTIHELQAIVNLMLIRTKQEPFCRFQLHPVLVISYMAPQHGRILQALYDGERLAIQYSQVWSFEVEETAPVELFLRYHLSQPVGLDGSICARESSGV